MEQNRNINNPYADIDEYYEQKENEKRRTLLQNPDVAAQRVIPMYSSRRISENSVSIWTPVPVRR